MNRLGDDGAQALAVALKSNTTLTKLDLRGSCRLPASLRCASDENIALLADNRIGNDGAGGRAEREQVVGEHRFGRQENTARRASSTVVDACSKIRSFFADNRIGVDGVKAVAAMLASNESLDEHRLSSETLLFFFNSFFF